MACYKFQETGQCNFGDNCRFSHGGEAEGAAPFGAAPRRMGGRPRGVCYSFQETGDCKYGDGCRFSHGQDDPRPEEPQDFGTGGFQSYRPRRSNGVCFGFRDTGSCQFGDRCRFSHDLSGGGNAGG